MWTTRNRAVGTAAISSRTAAPTSPCFMARGMSSSSCRKNMATVPKMSVFQRMC